jgi:hypothetical protein
MGYAQFSAPLIHFWYRVGSGDDRFPLPANSPAKLKQKRGSLSRQKVSKSLECSQIIRCNVETASSVLAGETDCDSNA